MNLSHLSQKLKEYRYIKTSEEAIRAVKQYGNALQYVSNQTDEICLEAVKQEGLALKYVQNQTDEICLEAVKKNGYALQYVRIDIKEQPKKLTISEIKEKFGCEIEIIEG